MKANIERLRNEIKNANELLSIHNLECMCSNCKMIWSRKFKLLEILGESEVK